MNQKPTLVGVITKLNRAKLHTQAFEFEVAERRERNVYRFSIETYDYGTNHIYRADSPPATPPEWSALVGDAVHNLRSALDHLAWQLVLMNGGTPTSGTQFPIRQSCFKWSGQERRPVPTPLELAGGVSPIAMALIDEVQPYNRGKDARTHELFLLNELDVIDKHRHLVLAVVAVRFSAYSSMSWVENGMTVDTGDGAPIRLLLTKTPLKHGEIVAKVTWPYPKTYEDTNFQMTPDVLFGKGAPRAIEGEFVRGVLNRLIRFVEDEVLGRFRPLFPAE